VDPEYVFEPLNAKVPEPVFIKPPDPLTFPESESVAAPSVTERAPVPPATNTTPFVLPPPVPVYSRVPTCPPAAPNATLFALLPNMPLWLASFTAATLSVPP
jgi:hypothetical protein